MIEVPFGCLCGFRIVFLDVLHREEGPSYKITSFNCLEPHGFDRVSADSVHPLDALFSGGKVVDTVCLAEDSVCLFGRGPGLPLPAVLNEQYAVAAVFVANPNEEWLTVAGDEHIGFFVDGGTILGED